jgi:hypothetical protein
MLLATRLEPPEVGVATEAFGERESMPPDKEETIAELKATFLGLECTRGDPTTQLAMPAKALCGRRRWLL